MEHLCGPEHQLGRIDRLLEESWARRYDNPQEMLRLAKAALREAERLDSKRQGAIRVADVRARVIAEIGNAYRVSDQLVKAAVAFQASREWWASGTRHPCLLNRIAEYSAALYCHQRNFSTAIDLLTHTFTVWKAWGDRQAAGRTRVTAGLYTWYSGSPEEALSLLCEGLELIDPRDEPQLALAATHNLFCVMADLGYFASVERCLARSLPLYRDAGRLNDLRRLWLQAVVAGGLGRLGEAELGLLQIRQEFLDARLAFPAGMVSLDLALVWMRMGRFQELEQLAGELVGVFRELGVSREVIAALILLRRACRRRAEQHVLHHLRKATSILRASTPHQPAHHPLP